MTNSVDNFFRDNFCLVSCIRVDCVKSLLTLSTLSILLRSRKFFRLHIGGQTGRRKAEHTQANFEIKKDINDISILLRLVNSPDYILMAKLIIERRDTHMEIAKLRTTYKNDFFDKLSKIFLFFFFFLIEVVSLFANNKLAFK